jgi:phosphoenolpyruvate carboxykinase (GTP)
VSIKQCPSYSPEWEKPEGVPISAILFGARRQKLIPLVYQSFNWQHGTFLGATLASETTAAATGAVGVVRRDPMAMLPFCGYNMGDHFGHWLKLGHELEADGARLPKIFTVNWFRTDADGKFVWPGFGENMRVLKWIVDRVEDRVGGVDHVFGVSPRYDDLQWSGLAFSPEQYELISAIHVDEWRKELASHAELFGRLKPRLPHELEQTRTALERRLAA